MRKLVFNSDVVTCRFLSPGIINETKELFWLFGSVQYETIIMALKIPSYYTILSTIKLVCVCGR